MEGHPMLAPDLRDRLINAVTTYDLARIKDLAEEVLAKGNNPLEAIEDGLMVGLREVGQDFETGDRFLPELVASGEVMKIALSVFQPFLLERRASMVRRGRVVIGTVKGDIHNLGKNLVATMLEVSGFEVTDLGVDVPAAHFLEVVKEKQAQVLGLSSLMSTTVAEQRTVIEALRRARMKEEVKVVVGGAAATPEWAETIGADGYAPDAPSAVSLVSKLLGS
jgi:5-methyltetrahydrofolate--homocysteine methyltransferase